MTDEERREVAARLQRIIGKCKYYYPLCLLYNEIIGGNCEAVGRNVEECDNECFDSLLARLADLIEPEERTCRNIADETYREFGEPFKCSECGADPHDGESFCCGFSSGEYDWRFCPNCGAKVVEQ